MHLHVYTAYVQRKKKQHLCIFISFLPVHLELNGSKNKTWRAIKKKYAKKKQQKHFHYLWRSTYSNTHKLNNHIKYLKYICCFFVFLFTDISTKEEIGDNTAKQFNTGISYTIFIWNMYLYFTWKEKCVAEKL